MTLLRRKKKEAIDRRPRLDPVLADPAQGLTEAQVSERMRLGYANTPVRSPGKTVRQIILSNVFTYFNIIFFVLAGFIIAVRSWNNLMFMGVVLVNLLIGIVQELKSKKTLDHLNLLTAPRGTVIRDGREQTAETAKLVRDDVVIFRAGDQIYADAEVVSGDCLVNEALVTGEADEIRKGCGEALRSGSFLVAGECRARLTAVGADSYAGKLTISAKQGRKPRQGEMMRSLTRLVKWIGAMVIPLGVLLCIKEVRWLGRSFADGIVSTVAALTGVIPQGLYLLTSLALLAGVLRLAAKKTLVHDLSCIETLARVDTLCVDKTGTITEDKMAVDRVELLCPERYTESDIALIMADYCAASGDSNTTMAALREAYGGTSCRSAEAVLEFTSAKKYGGVRFHSDETYLLGAPDVLLGESYDAFAPMMEPYAARGCRVLLLADYSGSLSDAPLSGGLLPLALFILSNRVRPEAAETFRYFAGQGVAVKVLSGDNPGTVSAVAKQAGIPNAEAYVDARSLTEDMLADAAERYTVFGRVTPEQKKALISAMKAAGHTVAMTGDGVNDVLALKEADCSVAMASGSDAACYVSDIVLLQSDFSVMPGVVAEGRRVINNIERSATLFLLKHIFHFLLSVTSLIFTVAYPFSAAQLSLVSALTAGFPAFVLAMEPNENRVQGKFLRNVLRNALPPALTDFVLVLGIMLFFRAFAMDAGEMGTVCAIVMGIVGICVILRISKPYTLLRKLMIGAVCIAFAFSTIFLKNLFTLSPLDTRGMLILTVFSLLAWPVLRLAYRIQETLEKAFRKA